MGTDRLRRPLGRQEVSVMSSTCPDCGAYLETVTDTRSGPAGSVADSVVLGQRCPDCGQMI